MSVKKILVEERYENRLHTVKELKEKNANISVTSRGVEESGQKLGLLTIGNNKKL